MENDRIEAIIEKYEGDFNHDFILYLHKLVTKNSIYKTITLNR